MTQPSPYAPLQGLPGFGGQPTALTGLPGFSPQQVQQPGTPQGAAALFQGAPNATAQFDATRPEMPGALETIATQTGRGLLDAVMASGALTGAAAEGVGHLTDWKGLEDFGRDLGRSSSGSAAMEAAAFLFGGGGQKGLSYAEKADHAIREQEQAWPMLTAISRIGGGVALGLGAGLATGAEAGAAATLRGTSMIGAYEGGAGGIQNAYSQNESLRDVLVSGLAGAALGGAGGAVIHGIAQLPGKALKALDEHNVMRQVFGDIKTAADDVAEAVRKAGGTEVYDAAKAILKERAKILQEVTAAGENPSVIRQVYDKATRTAGENLSKLAGDFDPGSWATKTPGALQKLLHRTPLLDRISEDMAADLGKLQAARPSLDFDLKVGGKLLKDADKPAAIAGLQDRVTQAIEQAADPRVRQALLPFSEQLQKTDAAASMAVGHDLVKRLTAISQSADVDQITAAYAKRQAQAIAGELGSDSWGAAGKAYKDLTRLDGPLDGLDAKALREALRHGDSSAALPGIVAENNTQLTAAFAARKQLGGEYMDAGAKKLLKEVAERADKAHAAVTFDGAPARRVLDVLSGAGRNIGESYATDMLGMGVGMAIGGVPGMLVARALSPVLGEVAAAAFGKSVAAAEGGAVRGLARQAAGAVSSAVKDAARGGVNWQQYTYHDNINRLAAMVSMGAPEATAGRDRALAALPPEIQAQAGTDMQAKLQQLMADIPKPEPNIRGEAWETLSNSDLRKAQGMWEATMDPKSVFSDFAGGVVDYDKVQYAWKQYPGLQRAAQAGLVDIITSQLSKDDRESIPDGMLSQLDNLFGFGGTLQPSLDPAFGKRFDALNQPPAPPQRPQSSGPLKLPTSQPTFSQRIAGARA